MSGIRPQKRYPRTALRRANLSDPFVVGKYRFSPYMGCEHGCRYCDGRAERYYVEGEFDRDIIVRPNVPDLLAREISTLREKGFISIASGISDAYQPVERREGLTGRCADVLAQFNHPAVLMTKSALAVRDLQVWARLNERARFVFLVSLTHASDHTRRLWEPDASTVDERLDALRKFKQAGCATGVLAMPLLPGITDTDENMHALYDAVTETGVDFIMPAGLTLRPGRQKDHALRHLSESRPDLVDRYRHIYREDRLSGAPAPEYLQHLKARLAAFNAEYRLPWLVPHSVYRDHLHRYDEVNVLLHHMVELYGETGRSIRPLRTAMKRYLDWLTGRKREYNRHRTWDYNNLDLELMNLCRHDRTDSGDGLSVVTGNEKLARFISDVVLDRRVFDYGTLELT